MMAGKARLLATVIENALNADGQGDRVSEAANNILREQLEAFQNVLIHDIDAKEFADIYAQTIAYGMFAARLHDPTLDSFSRHEAADLIPKTNPFLRKLFQYIAGYDLDNRIAWIVHALADIFRATDVAALLDNFGAATFLAEAINQIYAKFKGQQELWPSYVENHLIPRLNGFELLMASYAMAHVKLDLLLRETGYDREAGQRFRVYLTNSLEEHHPDTGTLFAGWLSHEANQANHVKRDSPVIVVMGNPPYSGISSNMGN